MRYIFALLLMFLLVGFMIQIHELGHAAAILMFGQRVEYINIGLRIFPYIKIDMGKTPVFFSPWLIGGGTGVTEETISALTPTEQISVYLTGPLINYLAVLLAYYMTLIFVPYLKGMTLSEYIRRSRRFISKTAKIKRGGFVGPVRIIDIGTRVILSGGFWGILAIWVSINLSLAVFNLLPIHPLDGGKIVIVLLKVVMGDGKVASAVLNYIRLFMFSFAMISFVYIMISDIFHKE